MGRSLCHCIFLYAYNGQATNLQGLANQTANQWQNIGAGVGQGAGALANAYAKNPDMFNTTSSPGSVNNVGQSDVGLGNYGQSNDGSGNIFGVDTSFGEGT